MNLYKREIYKSQLKHGLEWKRHKYLYKDANGNYVYPEDVKNKAAGAVSNIKNGASKAINAKKDELRLIGNAHRRPMSYDALDREQAKWGYARATREYANDDRREADKYKNGEYFYRGKQSPEFKKSFEEEKARAIGRAHASEERAKQANSEANRFMEGNIKRNAANPLKRMAADAFVKYEHKRNVKKDKKWKEEHADELAANRKKEEAADERHAAAIRKEWALEDQRERGRDQEMERSNRASKVRKEAKANERRHTSEAQRKSAHAGYEEDRKNFPEGGSTEELERQKRKTKARKSASKRFNELDQKNKRFSNSMEPNIQKQHSQINSAHQMATERRMTGNSFSDKKWNRQNLYSVNYYDQSGSVERQKRKTALRKRHKK